MKKITKILQDKTNELQNDCHAFVENTLEYTPARDHGKYQDTTNVWIFMKLASLQLENESLKNKLEILHNWKLEKEGV